MKIRQQQCNFASVIPLPDAVMSARNTVLSQKVCPSTAVVYWSLNHTRFTA